MQDGVEKALACVGTGGEPLFQLVAETHEFIDFGDDAVLFGEWREWYQEFSNVG